MSEAETGVGRRAAEWKHEASHSAISAVTQAEDIAEKAAHSADEAITRGTDEQRSSMREAADKFENAGRHVAQGQTFYSLSSFASTNQNGLQDLQECLAQLVFGVVQTNLRLAQELFLVEDPRAYAELQQRFFREYFEAFRNGAAALGKAAIHLQKALHS